MVVSKSWLECGIWPFDWEAYLDRGREMGGRSIDEWDLIYRASRFADADIMLPQTKEISRIRIEATARRISDGGASLR